MQTYRGSCHCKRVRFEIDVDLASAVTTRCNCTSCWKRRWWGMPVKPEHFRLLAGADDLVKWRPASGPGGFCRHCGVATFASIDPAPWNDGAYVSVNIPSLDDVPEETLSSIRIDYLDGRSDTWQSLTGPTRHL